jgi:hypothetical protein
LTGVKIRAKIKNDFRTYKDTLMSKSNTVKPNRGQTIDSSVIHAVAELTESGKTFAQICKELHSQYPNLTPSKLSRWFHDGKDPEKTTKATFRTRLIRAREIRRTLLEEDLLECIQRLGELSDDPATKQAQVTALNNRIQAIEWTLSRLLPERYGDKVSQGEMTGGITINVVSSVPLPDARPKNVTPKPSPKEIGDK